MPSNVIHNYFAKTVRINLSKDINALIDNNSCSYSVGAQGPDLLFYLKFEKEPLRLLGEYIHKSEDIFTIFKQSADYCKKTQNDSLTAFLLGQLCHYASDKVFHPYVYFLEKKLLPYYKEDSYKSLHVIIESAFDYLCVKNFIKANPIRYKSYKNLNIDKPSRETIAIYYSEVIAPYFNTVLPIEKAERVIRLMRAFLRILDDSTGIKYVFIRLIERLAGSPKCVSAFVRPRRERIEEDWFNHNRTPFQKYSNKEELSSETFEEMLIRAKEEAVGLIENFYLYLIDKAPLDKSLYNSDYCGKVFD